MGAAARSRMHIRANSLMRNIKVWPTNSGVEIFLDIAGGMGKGNNLMHSQTCLQNCFSNRRIKYFMRAARHIIGFMLIAALLASGLPYFSPDGASRGRTTDLRDAIALVREFARTAENPETFASSLKKTISAFQEIAGLKTTVLKAKDSGKPPFTPNFDLPCLLSLNGISIPVNDGTRIFQSLFHFHSVINSPASPPPEKSPVC